MVVWPCGSLFSLTGWGICWRRRFIPPRLPQSGSHILLPFLFSSAKSWWKPCGTPRWRWCKWWDSPRCSRSPAKWTRCTSRRGPCNSCSGCSGCGWWKMAASIWWTHLQRRQKILDYWREAGDEERERMRVGEVRSKQGGDMEEEDTLDTHPLPYRLFFTHTRLYMERESDASNPLTLYSTVNWPQSINSLINSTFFSRI